MKEKLDQELPGIFNWAIEGLKRLEKTGKFTEPKQVTETTKRYQEESDVFKAFVTEMCDKGPEATHKTSQNGMYQMYRTWSKSSGYLPVGKKNFKREMTRLGFPPKHEDTGNYYMGLLPKSLIDQAML